MTAMTVETAAATPPTARPATPAGARRAASTAPWEPLVRWDAQLTVEERSSWGSAPPREPSIFGLRREAEVPALLRRSCPESELAPPLTDQAASTAQAAGAQTSGADVADGRRPTALASEREERRQITAISAIVCQATLETLAGVRPASQLHRWLEPSVWEKVAERAELVRHVRTPVPHAGRRGTRAATAARGAQTASAPPSRAVRRVRCERVGAGSWEVSVVLDDGARTRACALRLQAHRGRWRVCALELG